MPSSNLREFLATQDIPQSFSFLRDHDSSVGAGEPIRIRGTLQAGNDEFVYVLSGVAVLEIPADTVTEIRATPDAPPRTVEVLVSPTAAIEARMQFLLIAPADPALPPALVRSNVDYAIFNDPRHQRDQQLIEKLRGIGVPIPAADDGGAVTYSYLSSATTKTGPDGGTDSDPIRTADD